MTLAESCIMDAEHLIGATVLTPRAPRPTPLRADALLFGESAGRIVVSCERRHLEPLLALAKRHRVSAAAIGTVGGAWLTVGSWIEVPVEELSAAWRSGLRSALDGR